MKKTKYTNDGMVDISSKLISLRKAVAGGSVVFSSKAFKILLEQGSPKGDVFETARLAGVMAAKKTPDILPFCHPLLLEKVSVKITPVVRDSSIKIEAEVVSSGKTGIEMEALTAVSAACLCVYDMMKWVGQDMKISDIKLLYKSGGKTGVYKC